MSNRILQPVDIYENAYIVPVVQAGAKDWEYFDIPRGMQYIGGVQDSRGAGVAKSSVSFYDGISSLPIMAPTNCFPFGGELIDEDVSFGGFLRWDNLGNLLAESLTRLWYLDKPFVFVADRKLPDKDAKFLMDAGLKLYSEPVAMTVRRFRSIHVPVPASG